MVFSSIPVYLDPPNWHQQQNLHHHHHHHHHQLASSHVISTESPQLPPLPPQQLPPHVVGAGSGSGPGSASSIRPGSMADRARLAKIPQPEAALKCPRCESTNTKFCYFNNYSLTQPRHFCKTCRRYWTRGGALRNVPVGGGCRRNKKNKSSSTSNSNNNNSRSKSPATSSGHDQNKQAAGAGSSSNSAGGLISPSAEMIGHLPQVPQLSHNPSFMASIQNLTRFGSGVGNLGLNFSTSDEIAAAAGQADLGFQIGSEVDQWRLQQFPLLGGGHHDFESTTGNLYPFQGTSASTTIDHHHQGSASGMDVGDDHHHNMSQNNDHHNIMIRTGMSSSGSRVSQYPPVKMEERQGGGLNLLRSNLGISSENSNHHNYNWGPSSTAAGSTAWTDLSALNSSTTTTHHIL